MTLAGLGWSVPDFSTVSLCRKGPDVAIPYRPGTDALHLPIDSTGIKAEREGEWRASPGKEIKGLGRRRISRVGRAFHADHPFTDKDMAAPCCREGAPH